MSHRACLSALALLCVAGAAYGSFIPLRWRPLGWAEGLRRAAAIPIEPVWYLFNGDFFTNVLVFLPIGFFAAGAITGGRPNGPRDERVRGSGHGLGVTATVLIGSAVLSTVIELGQVFVRDRTPSWSDIYAQTLGGLGGAVLWMLIGMTTLNWLGGALRAPSRETRVQRLLALYVAGWTLYRLLPTGFPKLAHPLLHLWTARQDLSRLVLAGPLAVAALSAVPVGACAALLGMRWRSAWASALLVMAGLGLLVLADRVRQVSFMPADGHLASGLLGFSSGWLMARYWSQRAVRGSPGLPSAMCWTVLVALLALIGLFYLAPFDFGVSAQALEQRVRALYTRVPFHRYYWLPPLVALGEVATLALLSTATSVLVSLARRRPSTRPTVIITTVLFALVEWAQLYLPARRADPTDVLIALGGAVIGTVVARALADGQEAKGMAS